MYRLAANNYLYIIILFADFDAVSQTTIISSQSEEEELEFWVKLKCKCRKCTIRKYLEGEDCSKKNTPRLILRHKKPKSSKESTERYMAYQTFKSIIKHLAAAVNAQYQLLLRTTTIELETQYPLLEVKEVLKRLINPTSGSYSLHDSVYDTPYTQPFENITSYTELQNYLDSKLCCWFNIDVITELRTVFLFQDKVKGTDTMVSAYREQQISFMKRCCILQKQCDDKMQPMYTEIRCDFQGQTLEK